MTTEISNTALCEHFNIVIYPVESMEEDPPPERKGKFFVSTMPLDFENAPEMQLVDSIEAGEALAVENLNLRKLYALELEHGPQDRVVLPKEGEEREWWVVSTILSESALLVQCRITGITGLVRDPSKEEWAKAYHAPSSPYRWTEADRVSH